MCTLFYSTNSHRKIVHLCHCKVLQRIPKENRRSFDSLEEAEDHGYRLCSCCPPIAQKYRKERIPVKDFCTDHEFTISLLNGAIHVISRHDSWQIITNGKKNTPFLYHRNKEERSNEKYPSVIPGYHSQAYRSTTILGYLQYIDSHDRYRDEHPFVVRSAPIPERNTIPGWVAEKYGKEFPNETPSQFKPIKGTKRYRKEQARKKRQQRRASIQLVYALLDELAAVGS